MIEQVILAAGLSSRMGDLKPLLEFDGQPLLGRLLAECLGSRVDAVIVVLGHRSEEILDAVDLSDAKVVINPDYRSGQTSSLQAAIRAVEPGTRAFLNLPVDHPLVTRREIDTLVDAYRNDPDPTAILVPDFHGREGRPILFASMYREAILELEPAEPSRSVLERFASVVHRVPISNPHTMRDMDTPEDYRECRRLYRQRRRRDVFGVH